MTKCVNKITLFCSNTTSTVTDTQSTRSSAVRWFHTFFNKWTNRSQQTSK